LENALEKNNGLMILAAYIFFGLFVILGLWSAIRYTRTALGKEPNYQQLLKQFDNVLLIQNPNSSNASRAKNITDKLHRLASTKPTIIKTSPDHSENAKSLKKYLSQSKGKTLLLIGGGDGTSHDVVNILMSKDLRSLAADVAILPLWGGNANDFAYMLNGLSLGKKMSKILIRGKASKLYPLEITVEKNGKSSTKYAMCYASFGASAFVAQHFQAKPVQRGKPLKYPPFLIVLQEIWRIGVALKKAKTFTVKVDGETITIFDEVFVNGSRLSKMNTLPVKLNQKAYYHTRENNKHPLISRRIASFLTGRKIGEIISKPTTFTLQQDALAQFDGEVNQLAKGTKITVALATHPIQAITTKLK